MSRNHPHGTLPQNRLSPPTPAASSAELVSAAPPATLCPFFSSATYYFQLFFFNCTGFHRTRVSQHMLPPKRYRQEPERTLFHVLRTGVTKTANAADKAVSPSPSHACCGFARTQQLLAGGQEVSPQVSHVFHPLSFVQ
ncbi:unnamed protein product [Ectocarpus fasciculatus]